VVFGDTVVVSGIDKKRPELSRSSEKKEDLVIKIIISFVASFLIGVACRWFDIPAPSPPKLIGALIVVAMTLGYVCTDKLVNKTPATTKQLCGGPSGEPTPRP
jgi:XapX domain-containing protein